MLKTTVLAVVLATGAFGCAADVTEGTATQELSNPDYAHTGVGSLVVRDGQGTVWQICSGALVSPTVFLTAGHCTEAVLSYGLPTFVTFDQQITNSSTLFGGAAITSPSYSPAAYNINNDSNDIGVFLLDQPVTHLPSYPMVAQGVIETLRSGTPITAVGYGVDQVGESGKPGWNYANDMDRDLGTVKFRGATSYIVASQVNTNGMCFGDSGGPDFVTINGQEQIAAVSVVINGYDCNEMAWLYRVDGAATRAFLGQYVTLP